LWNRVNPKAGEQAAFSRAMLTSAAWAQEDYLRQGVIAFIFLKPTGKKQYA
jgi:hypothetical protein